jgi:hypothetical protein
MGLVTMPSMSVNTDFNKQRTASSSNELPEKIESSFPQTPTLGHSLPCVTKKKPSVFLLRQLGQRRPDRQLTFLLANVNQVADVLREGAVAVFEETRIRVRQLPIDLAIESTEA